MRIWLQVWVPSRMLEEMELSPLPADVPTATANGMRHAKLLAIKHAAVAGTWPKLQILDDTGHPLAETPEIEAMEQAIQTAFRNPF